MKMMLEREYDAVVMGAGLSGSILARQLKLQFPQFRVAVIDEKTEFDYWVGESTLAIWDDYMRRHLRLARYLESSMMTKHGLRWFFDTPEKDLRVQDMSESGRERLFELAIASQLDRAKFDTDMARLNREIGVDVFLGTR